MNLDFATEAARNGCKDFTVHWGRYVYLMGMCAPSPLPETRGDYCARRRNRYAACVCIEWWQEQLELAQTLRAKAECSLHIDDARAFKREYGAE